MVLKPRSYPTLLVALLLTCGVPAATSAEEGVAAPSSLAAEVPAALADSEVPGLNEGAGVLDRLRVTQEILGSGVSKAAQQELERLIGRIDALLMRGAVAWPASYQSAGELWVPVKAEAVRILVDVPEILPRPNREGQRETAEELLVPARRIDWLPLERTRTLLTDALQAVVGQEDVPSESQERVAEALTGIRQTTRLEDPALEAYRAVKAVLKGGGAWQADDRDHLRQAADDLAAADETDPEAREIGDLAEAAAPDIGRLTVVAAKLRARIAARQTPEGTPGGAPRPVGAPGQ